MRKAYKRDWERRKNGVDPYNYRDARFLTVRQRARILIDVAKSIPCTDCGGCFPIYCMDMDHVDPSEKRMTIGKYKDHRFDELLEELPKCEAVCVVCHRLRSLARLIRKPRLSAHKHTVASAKSRDKILAVVRERKNRPCVDCDRLFPGIAMEFDHRKPSEKGFDIATGHHVAGMAKMVAELDKCDVLCAVCHRKRTWSLKHYVPNGRM